MLVNLPHKYPKRAREIVRTTEELLKESGITEVDGHCLAQFAYHAYKAEQARDELEKQTLTLVETINGNKKTIQNPLLKIHRDESTMMLKFMNALGMSPEARKRLAISLEKSEHIDSLLGEE